MNRLNKTVQINPTFAWTDWQLYDMEGSVAVANTLNKVLKEAVNDGEPRDVVKFLVLTEMEQHSRFGAVDTEPLAFLGEVLDEIFN